QADSHHHRLDDARSYHSVDHPHAGVLRQSEQASPALGSRDSGRKIANPCSQHISIAIKEKADQQTQAQLPQPVTQSLAPFENRSAHRTAKSFKLFDETDFATQKVAVVLGQPRTDYRHLAQPGGQREWIGSNRLFDNTGGVSNLFNQAEPDQREW